MSRASDVQEGFRVNTEPKTLLSRMKQVMGKPNVTKKEYQDRVETLVDCVFTEYDEDVPLQDRIHETVDGSRMVVYRHKQNIPIFYHQNEPRDLKAMIEEGEGLTDSLAFACLLADVEKEVYDRIDELEGLVESILEDYEHVAQVHLVHTPGVAELVVPTIEEDIGEYHTPYIRINTGSKEIIRPFQMTLTLDGFDTPERDDVTTLYTKGSVGGKDDRSLDEGLDILRGKLGGGEK